MPSQKGASKQSQIATYQGTTLVCSASMSARFSMPPASTVLALLDLTPAATTVRGVCVLRISAARPLSILRSLDSEACDCPALCMPVRGYDRRCRDRATCTVPPGSHDQLCCARDELDTLWMERTRGLCHQAISLSRE